MSNLVPTNPNLPDYLQGHEQTPDIPAEVMSVEFLKLIQKLSPEISEGAKPGDIVSSITGKNFGPKVDIVVVRFQRMWRFFNEDGRIVKVSTDGETWNNGDRVSGEESWKRLFWDFFVMIPGSPIPYIVSMSRTSSKTGKEMTNALAQETQLKGLPLYAKPISLYSKEEVNDKKQSYQVWQFLMKDEYVDEATSNLARELRERTKFYNAEQSVTQPSEADKPIEVSTEQAPF